MKLFKKRKSKPKKKELVNGVEFKFSFTAFLFTFMYYYAKGDWYLASILFLTASFIPLKDYFLLGLVVGFLAGNNIGRTKKVNILRLLFACISLLVFCFVKYTTLYWLGFM